MKTSLAGQAICILFYRAPLTHFDASFVIPASVDLADAKLKIDKNSLQFSKDELARAELEFRAEYFFFPKPVNKKTGVASSSVMVHTNRPVKIEQVKIGNFTSNVESNGNSLVFRSEIHASARQNERSMLLKLKGIEQWIQLKRELPFVNRKE